MKILTGVELKMSCFIIGMTQAIWGIFTMIDGKGRLSTMMEVYGVREEFSAILLIAALLTITGSVFPCRTVRHYGLILTPVATFPAAGFAFGNNVITIGTLLLPFLGAMALLIMWFDVRGKPREKSI